MSEEQPIYSIVEMAATVKTDQEDREYTHLAERVAVHYQTLLTGGMDRKTAREMTVQFQDYLLCIVGLENENDATALYLEGE